ncbi:MAG: peptidoglycan DD-metalloendopeptidase family protein [Aquificota bacterium]|nr:peptidoglycan DD-metalloendopeptidase family protein [Aquificota bacterium]
MRDKYINILIVSYGGKKARSVRVNKRFLKAFLTLSVLIISGLLTFSVITFKQNIQLRSDLARLKEEKESLMFLLAEERRKNQHLERFREKVEELEGKLVTIERFLRKKGIRRVPSGVGGARTKVDLFDIEYVSFLQGEADRFHKYLTRIPLGPPVWGRVTSHYGYRTDPFSGKYEFHEGVDIKAPWGTPVRATAEGKVIFAGWKPGYGKTVIIRHAFGYTTLYGHLSRIKVKRGRWVRSGDIIGYVGSSGRSTGPHVHYEVWRYSRKVNPLKYMYVRW